MPLIVALAGSVLLMACPSAFGQTPGDVYTHDSPAGAEYQLPHERARREASGPSAGTPRGDSGMSAGSAGQSEQPGRAGQGRPAAIAPPLFGAGVPPARAAERSQTEANGPESGSERGKADGRAGATGVSRTAATRVASDSWPIMWLGAILVVVLMAGSAIGLLLRRGRRQS